MNKRINFNIKDRKVLYVILCIVLISVFTLTIAYAALNAVLTISGNAQVTASNWDVHFDNIKVTNGSVKVDEPRITSPTTATFSTTLSIPGNFYEFTIDVVNAGTIDAVIDNITKTPTLTTEQAKYLKYEITYQNNQPITVKQLVEKDSFVRLKIRVEYRSDINSSDLPPSSETLVLGLQLDYTQSDGSGSIVSSNGRFLPVAAGDIDDIGTIVTIGSEQFYTIGSDDNNVKLLTMYNLYVGGKHYNSWTAYGDEATGIQDSTMLGWQVAGQPANGTTPFASTKYWPNTATNAYNSNSILYNYIENYKTYLSHLGVTPNEARTPTSAELSAVGCKSSKCNEAPSWVYSTSYWLGDCNSYAPLVYYVDKTGAIGSAHHNANNLFGVRPVIIISKDYFPAQNEEISFTIAGVSYQAMNGMTWEEWLASDYAPANAYSNYAGANIVISVAGYDVQTSEGTYVTLSDTIISGHAYITGSSSEPR